MKIRRLLLFTPACAHGRQSQGTTIANDDERWAQDRVSLVG